MLRDFRSWGLAAAYGSVRDGSVGGAQALDQGDAHAAVHAAVAGLNCV